MAVMDFLLAGLGFVPGVECAVAPVEEVALDEPYIHVRDLIALDCLMPASADRVGDIPVAKFPAQKREMSLSRRDVESLVRRRIPALGNRLATTGEGTVRVKYRANDTGSGKTEAGCFELRVPVETGDAIEIADVQPAACLTSRQAAPIDFDHVAGILRAGDNLKPGDYLGRVQFPDEPVALAGQQVLLCSSAGPVTIEREVEALQPVVAGGAAFVRGNDGRVFSTRAFCQR